MMTEVKRPKVLLTQVEDALEERQSHDRRQVQKGIPQEVAQERRQADRREGKKHGPVK